MKITVGIPSRGRPLDLIASVLTLDKLKSGGNQIEYLIAVDSDKREDFEAECWVQIGRRFATDLRFVFGPRPLGLGELHNRMAEACEPDATFMLWSDRVVPITEDWDHAIATAVMQYPTRVLWLDSIHLVGAGQFILPPAWRAALPGNPCPGYFPFWFEDSAVEEVDAFVHGFPRMATWAKCAGPRTAKTNRMRDLEFWIRFYASLRPQRLAEAKIIAANLGVAPRDNTEIIAHWERRDADFISRAPQLTEQYGAEGEPDESYLKAKANAEAIMAESMKEAA